MNKTVFTSVAQPQMW